MSSADRESPKDDLERRLADDPDALYSTLSARGGVVSLRPGGAEGEADRWGRGEGLPERYEVREAEDLRYLRCPEAPGLGVSIDRSYSITEADARKLGKRVILLDGAGRFEPLLDDSRQLYNLDHHTGCLRAFTLATCEQALILVLKGLELDKGDWKIYANEPDLDTLFAIWVLLNYRRIREMGPEARDKILPLLRLEGAIDANGFEIAEFCGLPQDLVVAAKARLDELHGKELETKKSGFWSSGDLVDYARDMLAAIDRLVYRRSDFENFTSIEKEYGHVEIGDNKVAVVCRDGSGIYEVERRLRQQWGDRLGIIALEKEPGHYTLRRVAALAGIRLERAYERLNLFDPNVDGRPPSKCWGGSDDIGGSPRPDGTGLQPEQIRRTLRQAYAATTPLKRLKQLALATGLPLLLAVVGGALLYLLGFLTDRFPALASAEARIALAAAVTAGVAIVLAVRFSQRRLWLFGWRWPSGEDWLLLVPLVILGSAFAAWVPLNLWGEGEATLPDARDLAVLAGLFLLLAATLEMVFRGLGHGLLILEDRVQTVTGRWFVSRPVWASASVYALVAVGAWLLNVLELPMRWPFLVEGAAVAGGGLLCGLALGMMRERSLSLWPGVAAQVLGSVVRLIIEARFSG